VEVFDAARAQDIAGIGREAALREIGRSLHVQNDTVLGDLIFDNVLNRHGF
jgi:hypothetical protein